MIEILGKVVGHNHPVCTHGTIKYIKILRNIHCAACHYTYFETLYPFFKTNLRFTRACYTKKEIRRHKIKSNFLHIQDFN